MIHCIRRGSIKYDTVSLQSQWYTWCTLYTCSADSNRYSLFSRCTQRVGSSVEDLYFTIKSCIVSVSTVYKNIHFYFVLDTPPWIHIEGSKDVFTLHSS